MSPSNVRARFTFVTVIALSFLLSACDEEFFNPSIGAEVTAGTARLSWNAPLTRENGQSLSMGEITHYKVWYDMEHDPEAMEPVQVVDGQDMSHTISGLEEGIWHFAIRTVDIAGLESQWSEVVTKVIN